MPAISVSPGCHATPVSASWRSRSGIVPPRSPGMSRPTGLPKPSFRAIAAMRSMPTRRAVS